jgi:transcriptional regulator with XRE-family HTH domain
MERSTALCYRFRMMSMMQSQAVGDLLREWRQRRRLSQLDLACEADISTRHLSFMETGRSHPSREMILHLAERLEVPLRERNTLLIAGGFAPVFRERGLEDPALASARNAIQMVLKGHEPYPAIAIDRHWTLVAANSAIAALMAPVDSKLLQPPVNVLRLSLHPAGLAPRIGNLGQWRSHLFSRLRQQIEATADPVLVGLLGELRQYPGPDSDSPHQDDYAGVAMPLELRTETGVLALIGTTMVFGTPVDITLSEIAIESFFPANAESAAMLVNSLRVQES